VKVDREFHPAAWSPVGHESASAELTELLELVVEKQASDLHLIAGGPPFLRVHGNLLRLEDYPILTPESVWGMARSILSDRQRDRLEQTQELDLSYSMRGEARFRVNVYFQRDSIGVAFRLIPYEIKSIEDLGLPQQVENFAQLARGLVLVTGPTGSGKSTTLASLVDIVNRERYCHIMTVEDPIEFLHHHQRSAISQREVGVDTQSFAEALKHVLRQDPDVILVGEMRDLETISTAITAAETGHLVFATLHTQDAPQTIDRIIDVFPPSQQQQIRVQLSTTLQGVVTQTLLRTTDGQGRTVATEILWVTGAVRHLIREGKVHQIYSVMQTGSQHGMRTMDQSVAELVLKGQISAQAAAEIAHNADELQRLLNNAASPANSGPVTSAAAPSAALRRSR
jgi:twitching motility protein PilT